MPRVATYLRVSTDQQSTENQRRELTTYLSARDWSVSREYCDEAISGVKERRPGLDQLLTDALQHLHVSIDRLDQARVLRQLECARRPSSEAGFECLDLVIQALMAAQELVIANHLLSPHRDQLTVFLFELAKASACAF